MDIEVDRGELTHWRVTEPEHRPLDEGEVRLRVERFGFSSNNITYAVIGDRTSSGGSGSSASCRCRPNW